MPVLSRIVSMALRAAELICAGVVAGIIGSYLEHAGTSAWAEKRFIYTEVIAGISILAGVLWLLPFSGGFFHWPLDILLSLAWFVAFGLLVNVLDRAGCKGTAFHWSGITHGGLCNQWRAAEAFAFISACLWLVSAAVGIWFTFRERREMGAGVGGPVGGNEGVPAAGRRGRWGRSQV